MKKINYKKILNLFLWIIALSGLCISWSFVSGKQKSKKIESLNVDIVNNSENSFISENDVLTFFEEQNEKIKNTEIKDVSIHRLEKTLNTHPAIENAEVSYQFNGELNIRVKQRRPMVRIFTKSGESYYIDSLSKIMPLNEKYCARVIVASGFINEPYNQRYNLSIHDIMKLETLSKYSILDDIYLVSQEIYADPLLSELIHQIYVDKEKNIILYPSIGNHHIVLGEAENIKEKLNKLKMFYTEGLNKADSWNKYSTINLKYKNLVVCTKK